MRKFLCLLLALLAFAYLHAQKKPTGELNKYQRSSLCLIMIDEDKMPQRDIIKKTFLELPIPDKYNDHNIPTRIFSIDSITYTEEDLKAYQAAVAAGIASEKKAIAKEENEENAEQPKKKGGFGKMLGGIAKDLAKSTASDLSGGLIDTSSKEDYAIKTYKYLLEQKVAKQLADRWFITPEGTFTLDTVHERGFYNATEADVQIAQDAAYGINVLGDAGVDLIGNTFVVVTRYRYLSKDDLITELMAVAQVAAEQAGAGGYASLGAKAGAAALKASLGDGYYVRTTSYLFQFNWNDTIAQQVGELEEDINAYNNADFFSINYIGKESAWSQVKAGIFSNKSEEELIKIATVNATDAVLAKLERKYEVFKTKTALATVEPYFSAKIGMKEGLEPGDKFDVLEIVQDSETKGIRYKKVGELKVAKDYIWDNRFMASEERQQSGTQQDFNATRFEGSIKNAHPGMLIRLKKSKK